MGRRSRQTTDRRIERDHARQQSAPSHEIAIKRDCLFCKQGDGGFVSAEHVFPESLGNTELVLPPGVVCDRCNNGPLSTLDQTICNFLPIKMRRTMLGIQSKAGKVPTARFSEGTLNYIPTPDGADPTPAFMGNSGTMLRETGRTGEGQVSLEWNSSGGRRMTPRYASELSRALLKSALECAWLDHGAMVREPRFDHLREAVLGNPRDGYFAVARKADPNFTTVSLSYNLFEENGTTRMAVGGIYYGVLLATDSWLREPNALSPEARNQFSVLSFTTSETMMKAGKGIVRDGSTAKAEFDTPELTGTI
jgi:HNH endonuclease